MIVVPFKLMDIIISLNVKNLPICNTTSDKNI